MFKMEICRMKNCNNEVVPDHLECGKCMDSLQEAMDEINDDKNGRSN